MERLKNLYDEIACIAYDLYEKRGRLHGNHLEDWLEAEKIIMKRHVKEVEAEAKIIAAGRKRSPSDEAKPKARKTAAKKPSTAKKKTAGKKKIE